VEEGLRPLRFDHGKLLNVFSDPLTAISIDRCEEERVESKGEYYEE